MKTKVFLLLLTISLFACTNNQGKKKQVTTHKKSVSKPKMDTLSAMTVTGDFDGDGKTDTLVEKHTFGEDEKIITQLPLFDEYEKEVDYYYKHSIRTVLKANTASIKELDLGTSFGVYCLINIGDNNKDGKDELALVIAYCDFSMLNSCKIYSICDGEWKMLNHFAVHENSFTYAENETLDPNKIEEYLEKKEGKWLYADALEVLNADDTLSLLKPLKIIKCH